MKFERQLDEPVPEPGEDQFTKAIERYTGAIPSSAYLALAVGSMLLSLAFQLGGRGKWGNFIAQWAPALLIIGVYNKLVKLEGHVIHGTAALDNRALNGGTDRAQLAPTWGLFLIKTTAHF